MRLMICIIEKDQNSESDIITCIVYLYRWKNKGKCLIKCVCLNEFITINLGKIDFIKLIRNCLHYSFV